MNRKLFATAIAVFATVLASTAIADDTPPNGQKGNLIQKVFIWPDLQVGDCHQIKAKLTLPRSGGATFTSDLWTAASGPLTWHSTIQLRKPDGTNEEKTDERASKPITNANNSPQTALHFSHEFPSDGQLESIATAYQIAECRTLPQ